MKSEKKTQEIKNKTIKTKKQATLSRVPPVTLDRSIKEIFTPSCIGHAVATDPINGTLGTTNLIVHDFLVDSTGLSKGGESVNPVIQAGLNDSKKIIYSILPEACKSLFKVSKPAGIAKGYFIISFGRIAVHPSLVGSGSGEYPASITFKGLLGTAPVISSAHFYISNGANNSYSISINGTFSNNFSFKEIEIVCSYTKRNLLPQFDYYSAFSNAEDVVTIPGTDAGICFALFGYDSPSGNDLGPIIKM